MARSFIIASGLAIAMVSASVGISSAQEGYRLQAGDILRVEVLEDPSLNRTILVAPDGRIALPLAGSVTASGRTVESVQADLAAKLGPNFAAEPNVFVALERQREARATGSASSSAALIDIFVMGEAGKAGKLQVERGTTVLQAFAQMGGFSKFAAVKRVQLRRGAETFTLNYEAIESGASAAGSTVLADGDVILVPQRKLFE